MVKTTDKQRVLTHMQRNGEQTTTKVANATGIPHPSVRRLLNELRAEGEVTRGAVHGSWLSRKEEVVESPEEPTSVVDTDTTIIETPAPYEDPLNIDDRPDVAEDTVIASIFKVTANDDTIYLEASSAEDAKQGIVNALGIPEALLTVTQVDALPEGEELFLLREPEPQSDDETGN